ncbi:hypothetical protein N9M10_04665 [Hellea sp.]|nr:hypothetical protein [Hellea sp.]
MDIKLASRLTTITCCLFLIGCEQKVSDPWPEILAKSVNDINICLDTEAVSPIKFENSKLTVYSKLIYEAENSADITSLTLGRDLSVPLSGFDSVSFNCKNGEACVSSKNLTRGFDANPLTFLNIENWKKDCPIIEAMNANRGIYNLIEYSMLKNKETEQVQ